MCNIVHVCIHRHSVFLLSFYALLLLFGYYLIINICSIAKELSSAKTIRVHKIKF